MPTNKAIQTMIRAFRLLSTLLLFAVYDAHAQKSNTPLYPISGQVVNAETGEPVALASFVVNNTIGVVTDQKGAFKLDKLKGGPITYNVSFLGYSPVERKLVLSADIKDLRIALTPLSLGLEEVVVTGMFTRKASSFTGSATTIKGDELLKVGNQNVFQSLKSMEPGLMIFESLEFGSDPNRIPDMQLRGTSVITMGDNSDLDLRGNYENNPNIPLFILDGFEASAVKIFDLDINRVESVTILKDAAATVIYGSEAANGVVVVETKAPAPGKLRFTYNGNYELQWPDLSVYDLMDAEEKLRIEEMAGYYSYKDDLGLMNYYNNLRQEVLRGVNTYWLAEPVQTSFSHRHGLTVEGGDRALRYKIYLGAKWAPGVMKESDLNTKTGKIDLNYRANKILINNSLSVDYSDGVRTSPTGVFKNMLE